MNAHLSDDAILQSVAATAAEMRPTVARYYHSHAHIYADAIRSALFPEDTRAWLDQSLGILDAGPALATVLQDLYLEPARSYIQRGGKLIRPFLTTLTLEAAGLDAAEFGPLIALSELVEVTSQILDDMADESEKRRGGLCAHVAYGTEHAYLSAVGLYNYFPTLLRPLPVSDAVRIRLYGLIAYEHFVTGLGSAIDLGWPTGLGQPSTERWITETLGRSSSYTYRLPVLTAAVAAGLDEGDQRHLWNYGSLLGLAFQIVDDRFNLLAPEELFGTVQGEDITGGKRTWLLLDAMEHMPGPRRKSLEELLTSRTRDQAAIGEAVAWIAETGAFSRAEERANQLVAEAKREMDTVSFPEPFREVFQDFASYVVERRR